jgi:hypothetical protein
MSKTFLVFFLVKSELFLYYTNILTSPLQDPTAVALFFI